MINVILQTNKLICSNAKQLNIMIDEHDKKTKILLSEKILQENGLDFSCAFMQNFHLYNYSSKNFFRKTHFVSDQYLSALIPTSALNAYTRLWKNASFLPFDTDGGQREDGDADWAHGYEVCERTKDVRESPVAVHEVGVREWNGERGHWYVSDGQIDQVFSQVSWRALLGDQDKDGQDVGHQSYYGDSAVKCGQTWLVWLGQRFQVA